MINLQMEEDLFTEIINFIYKCTLKYSMTIKSLTITEEAYEALKRLKHGNESFSDVILRMSKEKIGLVAKYYGVLKSNDEEYKEFKNKIEKRKFEINKEFKDRSKIIKEKLSL